jgi:NADPH:quinone reductase-like Zn-dependent oxidoreductase
MKAVVLKQYGGPEELVYEETGMPQYGPNEVLVQMKATSVNPIDYKLRSGAVKARIPLQLPTILGRDLAGDVVEWGRDVIGFPKGARVMALTNRTYAEFVAVDAKLLTPIPDDLKYDQAGALPLVTTTGSQLIERAVKPAKGQIVLVTGALGNVGRTALHVARKHGARVLAGVRSTEKHLASRLSVDGVVAIDNDQEIGNLHDLDAIADTVGSPTIQKLLKSIRKGGVLGSVLGAPEDAKKYDIRVEALLVQPDALRLHQLAEDVARDEFTIPIARVMKLEHIQEAHRLAEAGTTRGKIVLVPSA